MATMNWNALRKAAEEAGESTEGFVPVPTGTYDVAVAKADVAKFKNGTKEGWKIQFAIDGGPEGGRRVFTNLVISPESPKAVGMLLRQLDALNVRPVLDAGGTLQQVAAAMLNQKATIEITEREYTGSDGTVKSSNDVKNIKARTGAIDPVLGARTVATPAGLPI